MKIYKTLLLGLACILAVTVTLGHPQAPAAPVPTTQPGLPPETEAPSTLAEPVTVPREEPPFTVLLIGQDRRPGEERARSDAMILCTLKDSRLILTSLLRDLYVRIPGHGSDRINAAYALGGAPLLQDTLEENFGVRADGTAEVDFESFSRIIDRLGGVRLELREDECREIRKAVPDRPLEPGASLLTGPQALAYVRIRKLDPDGDFSRTLRQRKLLTALLEAVQPISGPRRIVLAAQLLPLVKTDLAADDILALSSKLFSAFPALSVESGQIPQEGFYASQCIRRMSVLVPDEEAARRQLQETLQGG